jgi:hypothetical protein
VKTVVSILFVCFACSCIAFTQIESEPLSHRDVAHPSTCTTQGYNLVDSTTCTAVASGSFIDASVFTGADYCAKIANAIASATTNSVTIDARGLTGSSTCTSTDGNPFSGSTIAGQLLLGDVVITTPVQWTIPNRFWIRGIGLASSSSTVNSIIQASTGSLTCTYTLTVNSTSYCPIVFIGPVNQDVFAAGISNLTVDCNENTDCIGAGSAEIQEGGGIDTVSFINQEVACVDFDATARTASSGISNSFMRNVNCTLPNAALGAVTFTGILLYATDGIAEISNVSVTVPGAGTTGTTINGPCVAINAAYGLRVNYLHCEHASNAIIIGPSTANTTNPTYGVSVTGLTTGNLTNSSSNSAVLLQNASNVSIRGLAMSPTTSSVNGIIDKISNSSTVTITDAVVDFYATSTSGGVLISTSSNTPSVLPSTTYAGLSTGNYNTAPVGATAYCTNCSAGSCSTAGSGALALRTANTTPWQCK